MMKKNLKEFVFVVEKSAAFAPVQAEMLNGFNALVDAQKGAEAESTFTAVFFNDTAKVNDAKPMSAMRKYNTKTYVPKGGSAFYDAMANAIDTVGARLADTAEEERPESVVVIAVTAGDDASTECTLDALKEKIAVQHYTYKWDFVLCGKGGEDLGITKGASFEKVTAAAVKKAWNEINAYVTSLR